MHTQSIRFVLALSLLTTLSSKGFAADAAGPQLEQTNTPRIEIQDYQFFAHKRERYERLVLKFVRKDSNPKVEPSIRTTPGASAGEANVFVDQAILMGAIPESLINDSYANKSKFLGAISLNTDAPGTGFSMRVSLKDSSATLNTFWLSNPSRLVIDAIGSGSSKGYVSEGSKAKAHHGPSHHAAPKTEASNGGGFLCFPAGAQASLTVVFHPKAEREDEMQNLRVNVPTMGAPKADNDGIVCYPRTAQVMASLSFDEKAAQAFVAETHAATPAPTPVRTTMTPAGFAVPSAKALTSPEPRFPAAATATQVAAAPKAVVTAPAPAMPKPTVQAGFLPALK